MYVYLYICIYVYVYICIHVQLTEPGAQGVSVTRHTTKLYKQFEKRKKKKEKNELTEPGAQGVSGGEHARLGRYAAGAARVSAKRDPYLSKETHICQKRPISVKRDPYLSKETHICVL